MATSQRGYKVPKLELTEVEQTLRRLLMDVARYANPEKPSVLRYTGGWVRDKLLGVGSHDIDVAIDDMMGLQFGLKMKEYLELPDSPAKYGLKGVATTDEVVNGKSADKNKIVQGLHRIEANPEKSKHLETVTTKVFGLDIDLVNLRKETYTEDSRNPQIEFGTPEEDALRRDATVNAMFYNLQTEEVEDFTGSGLRDMERKLIRTPLEPYQTFKDDPLRVLRLIRFASRLKYSIDDAAKEAMKDERIKDALELKISRERVGVELEKMLKGPNPYTALALIDEMDLYTTIFTDPTTDTTYAPEVELWKPSYELANSMIDGSFSSIITTILLPDKEHEYNAWVLSAFTPWFDAPQPKAAKPGAKVPPHPAVMAAREGIKATNKICDILALAIRNADEITSLKNNFVQRQKMPHRPVEREDPCGRDTLGMAIRRYGPTWRSQAVFALLLDVTKSTRPGLSTEWADFLRHLESLDLLSAYDFKPLIDGKALAKALDTRPGPWMKEALDVVMAWQLRNPGTASAEGALEAVKNKQGELVAVLIRHFLQLTIRPLFAKTQTPSVTAQGRKVANTMALPRRYEGIEDEEVTRPWKSPKEAFALELLRWVISSLDEKLTESHWPLLVPPVLKLLDDADVTYKVKGCEMLSALMKKTSPTLLARTGLGEVFQEAVEPSLSYLPTLTPEHESRPLLNAAYPALLGVGNIRFPPPLPNQATTKRSGDRTKFLTSIIHNHILTSLHFVQHHSSLVITLLVHLATVLEQLGTDSIPQLMYIIPELVDILSSPFASAEPALLIAATQAMKTLMTNAWPRIWFWRAEILRGVCECWIQLAEDEENWGGAGKRAADAKLSNNTARIVEIIDVDEEKAETAVEDMPRRLREVQVGLKRVVEMLVQCVEFSKSLRYPDGADKGACNTVDVKEEIRILIAADDRLADLFADVLET